MATASHAQGPDLEHGTSLPRPKPAQSEAPTGQAGAADAATPALDPCLSPTQAGMVVLSSQLAHLLASEPGTASGRDPEALHDMRIASRRLRSAMLVFGRAFSRRAMRSFERDITWLGELLGRVRDLDVFLLWLRAYSRKAPESDRTVLEAIIQEREAAKLKEQQALVQALASERYTAFKSALAEFLHQPGEALAGHKQGRVSRFADKSLRRLLRDVRSKAEAAGTDALKLHRVRIASKRVRYAAEFFASLYRDRLTDFVRLCKDIQDTLGLLHDAQTQLAYVESLPEAADPAVAAARRRLRRALKRQAWRQYRAYVRLRPGLLSRRGRKRVRGWLGPGNRLKCRPRRKAAAGTDGQPSREG